MILIICDTLLNVVYLLSMLSSSFWPDFWNTMYFFIVIIIFHGAFSGKIRITAKMIRASDLDFWLKLAILWFVFYWLTLNKEFSQSKNFIFYNGRIRNCGANVKWKILNFLLFINWGKLIRLTWFDFCTGNLLSQLKKYIKLSIFVTIIKLHCMKSQ